MKNKFKRYLPDLIILLVIVVGSSLVFFIIGHYFTGESNKTEREDCKLLSYSYEVVLDISKKTHICYIIIDEVEYTIDEYYELTKYDGLNTRGEKND